MVLCVSKASGQGQILVQAQRGLTLPIHPQYPEIQRPARALGWTWFPGPKADALWRRHHPRADFGFSVWALDPGNADVLGQAIVGTPLLRFSWNLKGAFRTYLAYGSGLAFLTKTFDLLENPTNIAMGSRVNSSTLLQAGLEYELTNGLGLQLDVMAFHISNANVRIPNLGLNVVGAGFGLRYGTPTQPSSPFIPDSLPAGIWQMGIRMGRGFTGFKTPDGPIYPAWTGSVYLTRLRRRRLRWRMGLEAFHTESSLAFAQNQDMAFVNPQRDGWGLVVFGGVEWLFGPFAIVGQLGPYLRRPFLMDYLLYTKWGAQWYLKNPHKNPRNSAYLGWFVHAHAGEADFAEITLGWVF